MLILVAQEHISVPLPSSAAASWGPAELKNPEITQGSLQLSGQCLQVSGKHIHRISSSQCYQNVTGRESGS